MKTLAEFVASREECADLAERIGPDFFDDSAPSGFVYDGDCYIQRCDDESFYLLLHNCEYVSADLSELEAILYLWCVTEFPEDFGVTPDELLAINTMRHDIGEQKAAAILAQWSETGTGAALSWPISIATLRAKQMP